MLLVGIVLLLLWFLVAHSVILLVLGIIAVVLGLFGNGYAYTRPAGGRRQFWY